MTIRPPLRRRTRFIQIIVVMLGLGACGDRPTEPQTVRGAPVVESISPGVVTAGAQSVMVEVRGSNFAHTPEAAFSARAGSSIPLPIEVHSATRMSVTLTPEALETVGEHHLVLRNPGSEGGTIRKPLIVTTARPTINELAKPQVAAGQLATSLVVAGAGFDRSSVVHVGGQARTTEFISRDTLAVTLTEEDLSRSGSLALIVINPPVAGHGGGTSPPQGLSVVHAQPQLRSLASAMVFTSGLGVDVYVNGSGFTRESQLLVDGAPIQTWYFSSQRLGGALPAGASGTEKDLSIVVRNPTPGGSSAAAVLRVRHAPSAGLSSRKSLKVQAVDLVASTLTGRLYASVGANDVAYANQVVEIDPVTATVSRSVNVGSAPTELAISGDGRTLYAYLPGTRAVRPIDVATLTAGQPFALGAAASEMVVLPGQPHSLAVSLANPGYSPSHAGVAVWDNGVRRPKTSPGHVGSDIIMPGDSAGVLYGVDLCCTGHSFFVLGVSADGVRIEREANDLLYGEAAVFANGRLYGSDGSVVDVVRLQRVGYLAIGSSGISLTPEPAAGRAYALRQNDYGGPYEIVVLDLNTGRTLVSLPLGKVDYPDDYFSTRAERRLVRWGVDGLAFPTGAEVVLVRSPSVGSPP